MSADPSAPLRPVSLRDVPVREWFEGSRFGLRGQHLSSIGLGEHYRVGVGVEELPPGRQCAPAHFHIFEEEHIYILEGVLTVRIGTASYHMKPGDYVCFPAGQKVGHCLINESDAPCRYVMIGERNPNEVAVYTHSNKVLVRALGWRAILDLGATRGYWHGENTGVLAEEMPPVDAVQIASDVEASRPISSHDVEWEDTREGTRFGGRAKHLTYAAVGATYRVGVLIESPAPGMRLAPKHYHMLEEEHALILEGQVTLLLGDEQYEMTAGDYVCFPAGQKVGHSFLNSGTGPCSYLMIGERNPNDVCVYTDSNKVEVKALHTILDLSAVKKYWDGEQTS
jgi:uncharacterized cupin superfamily protein